MRRPPFEVLVAAVMLVWALPDVPWWWRPFRYPAAPGEPSMRHPVGTPVVLAYLALALLQSVPFLWWRRAPFAVLGAALAALAVRAGLDRDVTSASAAVLVAAFGVGAYADAAFDRAPGRWLGRARGRWLDRARGPLLRPARDALPDRARDALLDRARGPWLDRARDALPDRARGPWLDRARGPWLGGAPRRWLGPAPRWLLGRAPSRAPGRWLGWIGLGAAAVVDAVGGANHRGQAELVALVGAAFLVGDAVTARRAAISAAVESAHLAERTRIARELHDVLAHQLSAIAVQSGAARVAGGDATSVLSGVERLSREALTELNHLLGVLRKEPSADPALRPAPGIAQLEALTVDAPAALSVDGDVRPLPAGLELSAFRIVQEALTNVARHAPGATARVGVHFHGDRLDIEVVNGPSASPAPPPGRGGRGIRGMRERAALYGGTLDADPRPDGGYAVTASLPIDGGAP